LLRDLELNWTAGLVLDNCRSVSHVTADGDVIDSKADEIAAAKLAVDGEVEHRQIAFAAPDLKSDTNGPHFFRPKGTLLANETTFVPCGVRSIVGINSGAMVDLHAYRSHRRTRIQRARLAVALRCGHWAKSRCAA
jgi:hypothetical protein